jgi:predicted hydrocarbon binding protein
MRFPRGDPGRIPIHLYSSRDYIHAIDSPVKVQILSLLRGKEMPFEEIVQNSGKAKSTVSIHLKGLGRAGIVRSRSDPQDGRKKIFSIDSRFLGELAPSERFHEDLTRYLSALPDRPDPPLFFRLIFRSLRLTLISEGINLDPILRTAGMHIGTAMIPLVLQPNLGRLLENLSSFWSVHQMGRIEVVTLDPLAIRIYDCFECKDLPQLGRPACAFDNGILSAIFFAYFQERKIITETKCYAMGDDYCQFVLEKVGDRSFRAQSGSEHGT